MNKVPNCKLCNATSLTKVLATENFEILKCRYCEIAFTNPEPTLPLYEELDFHSKDDILNVTNLTTFKDLPYDWKKLIEKQLSIISNSYNKEAAIMEIGCGEGLLLNELKLGGYENILGVEPSKTATLRAQKKNLNIINEYFSENLLSKKFDLVIMSHVFEHVKDIHDFIKQISTVLNKDGGILFTQTNYKGIFPSLEKENWYAWVADQHFWHFTPASLKIILNRFNYNLQELDYCSLVHPFDWKYKIANKLPKLQDQFIVLFKKNNIKNDK